MVGMILDRAIVFAVAAHSGMLRKGTSTPYILHPLEAAAIVSSMTDDDEVIATAILHDVLEDTSATADQIQAEFGERILSLVQSESENKREDRPASETWKIRKQETIDALMKESAVESKMLALGDKLSNIRAMYREHQKIGDKLWERFHQKNKFEHAWYYKSVAEATRELAAFPAWQEYNRLVKEVFDDQGGGSMNLCADKADGTSYFIDAEYTEGCLKISGHDLGKLPEEIFGRDEYEYFYSLDELNTNKLISALGVLQEDFMSEVQKRFSGLEGLIKWREFCDDNGIEYTFFNWY